MIRIPTATPRSNHFNSEGRQQRGKRKRTVIVRDSTHKIALSDTVRVRYFLMRSGVDGWNIYTQKCRMTRMIRRTRHQWPLYRIKYPRPCGTPVLSTIPRSLDLNLSEVAVAMNETSKQNSSRKIFNRKQARGVSISVGVRT